MKRRNLFLSSLLISMFLFVFLSLPSYSSPITVQPQEDTVNVIRNPAMGWVLYADAFANFPQASQYWASQDPYAWSASIFYIRLPWSQLEPQQGVYAWEHDQNFQDLVQGALDRGLQLAFRVYVDSEDSYRQATPEYVRTAGASGIVDSKGRWSPYVDDPIFQEKFSLFLNAFGNEYNDPEIVAYIDGNGLGRWGEGNQLKLLGGNSAKDGVLSWISGAYAANFSHVLLGVQYNKNNTGFGLNSIDAIPLGQYGYVIRKDTLGYLGNWFSDADKARIRSHFPEVPFYGENVYQHLTSKHKWDQKYASLRDTLEAVYNDAIFLHANTLDLRIPEDTQAWFQTAPDLVQDFIVRGGYRLVPEEITYPERVGPGEDLIIAHKWKNTAVGVLPNNKPQWNYKYKVAFALLDPATGEAVFTSIDQLAEPSDWIEGWAYSYTLQASLNSVPAGFYQVGFAIVDTTRGNVPAINLAINNEKTASGWYILNDTAIDDFENYTNTADLGSTWQWLYTPTSGANITRYLEAGTNQLMRVVFNFPAGSANAWGVVGRPGTWDWSTQTGIRFWIKAETTGDTPQYYQVRFHEGSSGDKWRSPLLPISELDPNGQYVTIPFSDFTDYGGFGGSKDNGILDLTNVQAVFVGSAYSGTAPHGGSTTLWVDDLSGYLLPLLEVYYTGSLSGTITYNYVGSSALFTFELREPGTTTIIADAAEDEDPGTPGTQVTITMAGGTGTYSLSGLSEGAYDVTIKKANALREIQTNVSVAQGSNTPNINFNLRGGDANADNSVGIGDMYLLRSNWGSGNGAADFNGDGIVGVGDMYILRDNWGETGAD
ncbi:MAG: hypothetical protein GXO98_00730 [Nitrospirae bacterium]|nr:hypothetical protein [Nitrospirota bacterium]